eukprot:COSAG06_NODE_640_length_13515_cov_6.190206_3_plen_73_part_00
MQRPRGDGGAAIRAAATAWRLQRAAQLLDGGADQPRPRRYAATCTRWAVFAAATPSAAATGRPIAATGCMHG